MIDRMKLAARVKCLEELGHGLMKEIQLWERMLWQGAKLPVPTAELQQYLAAIRQASVAISAARTTMERACRRLEEG